MDAISRLVRKEPAVLIGLLLSIVSAVADAIANDNSLNDWRTLGPAIAGIVIRQFVFSPATNDYLVQDAFFTGKDMGVATAKAEAKKEAKKRKPAKKKSE